MSISNLKTKYLHITGVKGFKGQSLPVPKSRHMGNMAEKRGEHRAEGSQMLREKSEFFRQWPAKWSHQEQ